MDSGWTVDEEPNFEDEREASKSEYATLRHAVEGPPSLPAYRNAPVKLEPAQSYAPSRPLMFGLRTSAVDLNITRGPRKEPGLSTKALAEF